MTNDQIKAIALANGFTLKPQPDNTMDLHPYVYEFARELIRRAAPKKLSLSMAPDRQFMAGWNACRDSLLMANQGTDLEAVLEKAKAFHDSEVSA